MLVEPITAFIADNNIMTTDDMVFIFCSNGVFIPWLALMIAPK